MNSAPCPARLLSTLLEPRGGIHLFAASLRLSFMYHKTVQQIEALLQQHNILYKKFEHEPVRTSEEAAATRPEYALTQGAKALLLRVKKNGQKSFVQIVLPGDAKFDSKLARQVLGASDIRFASEAEVLELTDGVKPGGVPPFGTLWNLPVFCDQSLFDNEEIIFNAGDRSVSIALSTRDWQVVVQPSVCQLISTPSS